MSTHKSLLKATILFSVLSILQPLANFILLPVYTRYFGAENFGLLSILNNISVFFSIVSGLNIATAVIAFYKKYPTEKELKRFIGSVISFSFYVNIVITVIFMLWGNGFARLVFSQKVDFYPNIFYAIFFGLFSNIGIAYFNFLKYQKQLVTFTVLTVIQFAVLLVAQYFFVVGLNRGVTGAMEAKVLVTILILLIIIFQTRHYVFKYIPYKIDILPQLKFAMYSGPASFIAWMGSYSDRSVIERFVHDRMFTLGKYSMVATVCAIGEIGVLALNSAIQPYIFDAFVDKNNKAVKNYYKVFMAAIIFIITVVSLAGSNLQFMIKNEGLAQALELVPLMATGYLFSGIGNIYGLQINYSQKSSYYLYIFGITMAVNVALNFCLIGPMGIYGVILAGIISKFFLCIAMIYFAEKCNQSGAWKYLMLTAIISLIIIVGCWFLSHLGWISRLQSSLIQFVLNILLILLLFKPSTIKNIIVGR